MSGTTDSHALALALLADASLASAVHRGEELVADRRRLEQARREEEQRERERRAEEERREEVARQAVLREERSSRRMVFGGALALGVVGIPAKFGVDSFTRGSIGFPYDFIRSAANFPDGDLLVGAMGVGVFLILLAGALSFAFRDFPPHVKILGYSGVAIVVLSGFPVVVAVALGLAIMALFIALGVFVFWILISALTG
jgi:hypothetical protein